ncbi:hypothetical protein Tco_0894459 [Tanacetum coccineum]|uniref:Uncharacterized protein n=1 Tax=Tanacetum coccineum TaxID=301880 RepID=A0ABQ5CEA2_9ASTR
MASFDHRLNPLFSIKECLSCCDLYTRNCGCSKGSFEDKILVPVPDSSQRPLILEKICLNCGDPVHVPILSKTALISIRSLGEVFQTSKPLRVNPMTEPNVGTLDDTFVLTMYFVRLVGKKEEERRIAEDQAAKDRYWKIPICYDDDEDYTIAITPFYQPRSTDDDYPYGEDIDYVNATPPDAEIVSLEVVEIVVPEVGGIDTNILLTIKDDILREKLLNVNLLIANIEALKDNPTLSFDFVIKYPSTFPNSFLEETNNFDNSLTESKTFRFNLEEISSGSTTTHSY